MEFLLSLDTSSIPLDYVVEVDGSIYRKLNIPDTLRSKMEVYEVVKIMQEVLDGSPNEFREVDSLEELEKEFLRPLESEIAIGDIGSYLKLKDKNRVLQFSINKKFKGFEILLIHGWNVEFIKKCSVGCINLTDEFYDYVSEISSIVMEEGIEMGIDLEFLIQTIHDLIVSKLNYEGAILFDFCPN